MLSLRQNDRFMPKKEHYFQRCQIQKKKDAKLKEKNFFNLRKLLREKNVMNDFKYFKSLELDVQEKILIKLKDINSFSNIEKPYRISLIESDIPVEFKSFAMKKINYKIKSL